MTVGLFAEIYLSDYIIFQPGLNYMQKGGTWEFPSGTDKFKLNYLELPLNLLYKKGKFMAGAGPSIGFGLNGKLNSDFANGSTTSYDATFSKEGDAKPKRFEFGLNLILGYELIDRLTLAVCLNQSLNENVFLIDGNEFNRIKNRYLGLRAGYIFYR